MALLIEHIQFNY